MYSVALTTIQRQRFQLPKSVVRCGWMTSVGFKERLGRWRPSGETWSLWRRASSESSFIVYSLCVYDIQEWQLCDPHNSRNGVLFIALSSTIPVASLSLHTVVFPWVFLRSPLWLSPRSPSSFCISRVHCRNRRRLIFSCCPSHLPLSPSVSLLAVTTQHFISATSSPARRRDHVNAVSHWHRTSMTNNLNSSEKTRPR